MFAHNHLASVINIKANTSRLKDAKPPCIKIFYHICRYLSMALKHQAIIITGRLFAAHGEVL